MVPSNKKRNLRKYSVVCVQSIFKKKVFGGPIKWVAGPTVLIRFQTTNFWENFDDNVIYSQFLPEICLYWEVLGFEPEVCLADEYLEIKIQYI